jgi:hypothetical protein
LTVIRFVREFFILINVKLVKVQKKSYTRKSF